MREYETVFILHPKVDESGIDREIESVKQIIADGKGELVGVYKWGRKKLAYQIRKVGEGFYVLARFHAEPDVLKELDRSFKLNEKVLRHLTVIASSEPFPPDLRGRDRRGQRSEGYGTRGGRRRSFAEGPKTPREEGFGKAAGGEVTEPPTPGVADNGKPADLSSEVESPATADAGSAPAGKAAAAAVPASEEEPPAQG